MKKKKNKKNGFTLIELLAVIIILGILMIIAIPSVTSYINNSRKSAYVDSAKEIISGARNLVNEGRLEMFDTGTTYYLPISCINTENGQKSPYGDFVENQAFVLVTYDGSGYKYYWVSRDTTGQGVKDPILVADLDEDDIESDIAFDYIKTNVTKDNTSNVLVLDSENCKDFTDGVPTAAKTVLKIAQDAGQLNQIPNTNIYIFKGGTINPPSNYVSFNGEKWRIIGIYGNQLKIIRVNNNGEPYAPDGYQKEVSNHTPNPGWGSTTINEVLNTTYYESLSDNAKNMIEDGFWNVGATSYNSTANDAYINATTSRTIGSITHTTPLTGKVGLIASYEYLYASDGEGCLMEEGNNYDISCGNKTNNWINANSYLWTMSADADIANYEIMICSNGDVCHINVYNQNKCVPAVFLKSSIKIKSGEGTSGSPYILE